MITAKIAPDSTILVLQAGAIGDVVMGTLTPTELKRIQPDARIIYWTHESLFGLLKYCPAIDDMQPWNKRASYFEQLAFIRRIDPTFIVDLTASLRSGIIFALSGRKTYRHVKPPVAERARVHLVDSFRSTVQKLTGSPQTAFPSLHIPTADTENLCRRFDIDGDVIGLVPGVGHLRPHRAWPASSWAQVAKRLLSEGKRVILIGGPDDQETGAMVQKEAPQVVNLCGELTLPETAAMLAACRLVVSGDTGPAHIAAGVGVPVVGLFGPTDPDWTGPYGCSPVSLSVNDQCCKGIKRCSRSTDEKSGACMSLIEVEQVMAKVADVMRSGCHFTR